MKNIGVEKGLNEHFLSRFFIAQMRLLMFGNIFLTCKSQGIIPRLNFFNGRISDFGYNKVACMILILPIATVNAGTG